MQSSHPQTPQKHRVTNQGTIKSKVKEVKQKVTTFSTDFSKLDFRANNFLICEVRYRSNCLSNFKKGPKY